MHMIVNILKIAGISALVIVVLLVFLLILLLFVPFYYRIYGCVSEQSELDKSKRNIEVSVNVQFLAFLLTASLKYTEEGLKGVLRILGIPIKRIGETKRKKKKQQKEETLEETIEETIEKEEKNEKKQEEQNDRKQDQEIQKEEDSQFFQKKHKFYDTFQRLLHFPSHLLDSFRKYYLHIRNAWKKFSITKENIRNVWNDEHIRNGISIIWKQCRRGLKHLLPRSVFLRLHFGCSNPAATGQIVGILSILYAFYGDTVQIKPEFDQTILEGKTELKGHISLFLLSQIAWTLYRNKEVRYVMKQIKELRN